MDWLLENKPANNKTIEIPAEFPGVDVEPNNSKVVPEVDQEVSGDNYAVAVASTNAGINHTSTVDTTGTDHKIRKDVLNLDPASYKEDYREIEGVDVPALEPSEIIDVDAEEEHFQVTKTETETHETPNQASTITSETTYDVVVKDVHDSNLDDNPDKENNYDSSAMGLAGRFLRRNRSRCEYYNIGRGNVNAHGYQYSNIYIQTPEQGTINDKM